MHSFKEYQMLCMYQESFNCQCGLGVGSLQAFMKGNTFCGSLEGFKGRGYISGGATLTDM